MIAAGQQKRAKFLSKERPKANLEPLNYQHDKNASINLEFQLEFWEVKKKLHRTGREQSQQLPTTNNQP